VGQAAPKKVTTDFVLRTSGAPAGTAANFLVHSVMEKYFRNNVLAAAPDFRQLGMAAHEVLLLKIDSAAAIKTGTPDPRCQYHMGAEFLTGKPRLALKENPMLGCIGSFIYHQCAATTLAKSPLIVRTSGGSEDLRYKSLDGYNDQYDKFCAALRFTRAAPSEAMRKAFGAVEGGNAAEDSEYVSICRMFGESPAAARARRNTLLTNLNQEDKIVSGTRYDFNPLFDLPGQAAPREGHGAEDEGEQMEEGSSSGRKRPHEEESGPSSKQQR
jgi:hypothetical protein